jgi:hypothetical protein
MKQNKQTNKQTKMILVKPQVLLLCSVFVFSNQNADQQQTHTQLPGSKLFNPLQKKNIARHILLGLNQKWMVNGVLFLIYRVTSMYWYGGCGI